MNGNRLSNLPKTYNKSLDNIPQSAINHLYSSLPIRVTESISKHGSANIPSAGNSSRFALSLFAKFVSFIAVDKNGFKTKYTNNSASSITLLSTLP